MRLIVGGLFQGRKEYAKSTYGADISIYNNLVDDVKQLLEKGSSEEAIIDELSFKAKGYDVVIAEEVYSGLTLVEADMRRLMEVYGRVLNVIAKDAVSVERVVCGLAISLK